MEGRGTVTAWIEFPRPESCFTETEAPSLLDTVLGNLTDANEEHVFDEYIYNQV